MSLVTCFMVLAACPSASTPTSTQTLPVGTASGPSAPSDNAALGDGIPEGGSPSGATAGDPPKEPIANGGANDASAAPPAPPSPDDMRLVPAGPFTMGQNVGGQDDEHPAHVVTLPAFWLDRTEVTNEAYAACVAARACGKPNMHIASSTHAGPDSLFARPNQPVVGVNWNDGRMYCAWKKKRLPREAEFEKACRSDDQRRFPWGNEPPTPERTVYGRAYGAQGTDEVGSHPSGRGPYGHDDLAGNVWEWMEDDYDPLAYTRAGASTGAPGTCPEILKTLQKLSAEGKQGFTGSNPLPTECEHVLRGGAYNYDGPSLRSMNRVHHPGRYRLVMTGFRCARDDEK